MKKKRKLLLTWEKNVNFAPSYFACITPRMDKLKDTVGTIASNSLSTEDSISSGEIFPYLSTADFDITRCNKRLSRKYEVGLKVWKPIADLVWKAIDIFLWMKGLLMI